MQRTIQNNFIEVFQIIQLGIFQIEKLKHFLSPEESLFEGSQGRFRSVSIRIDMELDRDEFAIKSFFGSRSVWDKFERMIDVRKL